jgi:hypothetical protein
MTRSAWLGALFTLLIATTAPVDAQAATTRPPTAPHPAQSFATI